MSNLTTNQAALRATLTDKNMTDLTYILEDASLVWNYADIVKQSGDMVQVLLESDNKNAAIIAKEGLTRTEFNKIVTEIIIEPAKRRGKNGFKNINSKEMKHLVWNYLGEGCYDFEDERLDAQAAHILERFRSEFNFSQNIRRIPNRHERVADWLAGLPLGIDYTYFDIITTSDAWHDMTFTDEQAEMICNDWFKFLAFKLIQMWQHFDLDLPE